MLSQWIYDVMITSLLLQNDVATSLCRNNDVIITSCDRWGVVLTKQSSCRLFETLRQAEAMSLS